MSLSTNKLILANATTNTAGAYFQTTTVTTVSGSGVVIPAGVYMLYPTANVTIQAYNGSANATVLANNVGGVIISDGINVYASSSYGTPTVTLLATNGGGAANSTFAS